MLRGLGNLIGDVSAALHSIGTSIIHKLFGPLDRLNVCWTGGHPPVQGRIHDLEGSVSDTRRSGVQFISVPMETAAGEGLSMLRTRPFRRSSGPR